MIFNSVYGWKTLGGLDSPRTLWVRARPEIWCEAREGPGERPYILLDRDSTLRGRSHRVIFSVVLSVVWDTCGQFWPKAENYRQFSINSAPEQNLL